jgi:hypothetical protein
MTETQDTKEVKFNIPDHTTLCKSTKCSCDYKDLPKTCNIRLLISELEIEVLKGKIIEIQYKNLTEDDKGEVDNEVVNENKRLNAENLKLKKQLERQKPQKKSKKSKDDDDDE